jgi:hypothetical protein
VQQQNQAFGSIFRLGRVEPQQPDAFAGFQEQLSGGSI